MISHLTLEESVLDLVSHDNDPHANPDCHGCALVAIAKGLREHADKLRLKAAELLKGTQNQRYTTEEKEAILGLYAQAVVTSAFLAPEPRH